MRGSRIKDASRSPAAARSLSPRSERRGRHRPNALVDLHIRSEPTPLGLIPAQGLIAPAGAGGQVAERGAHPGCFRKLRDRLSQMRPAASNRPSISAR